MPVTTARVPIGIFFCISRGDRLFVRAQFGVVEQAMVQSHMPFPHASALFVSMVEFACGAGLALGLLTPLCAAMLMGEMIVAIATNRIHSIRASGLLAWLDDFLYLPEVLYTLILIWLIFSGPGRRSVNGLIAWTVGLFGVERSYPGAAPLNELVNCVCITSLSLRRVQAVQDRADHDLPAVAPCPHLTKVRFMEAEHLLIAQACSI